MKKQILKEVTPGCELPYRGINGAFRLRYIVPDDDSIQLFCDDNGVFYIRAKGGSVSDILAGDNIQLTEKDGKIVISAISTAASVAAGQNISIDIDPASGTAIINSVVGGETSEHYKGVFDTTEDLVAAVPEPEQGDYGMVKNIVITDGGSASWNGQYKYCFFVNGAWKVVDQMLTFTDDTELLQQFYSVGGSSPVIYLHQIAMTGDFNDLRNIPIVATPKLTVTKDGVFAECATEGAEIWYTVDGTMPHVNGIRYKGIAIVSGAATFRFVGIKNGMINSLEAVVAVGQSLQAPVIGFDYHTSEITLTNPNASGSIYYTLDGSTPTSSSILYSEPFEIDSVAVQSATVKAVVVDSTSGISSPVSSETYLRAMLQGRASDTPESGAMSEYWFVGDVEDPWILASDSETYYTVDGTTPDYNSTPLTQRLYFSRYGGPVTLKARGYRPGFIPSDVRTRLVGYDRPSAPSVTFDASSNLVTLGTTGNVAENPAVPLKTTTDDPASGCRIYYTLDGSTPTDQSTLYTGPFQVSGSVTVKAVLVAYGQYSSDVATEEIVILAAPTLRLGSGYGDVWMTGPDGADIYYTLDGSTPTTESAKYRPYPNLPNIANESEVTVKAIAVLDGQSSAVAESTFHGLDWRDGGGVSINYSTGVCSLTPKIAADGADVAYRIYSGGWGGWYVYNNPVTVGYFSDNEPRVLFKQMKAGYIPNYYEADLSDLPLTQAPSAPSITVENDTAELALTGNTEDIPLQTNNNVPSMGARIYYTVNGTTPSAQNGTLYDGNPFAVPAGTAEIKAVTVCYGEFTSEVTTYSAASPEVVYAYGVRRDKTSSSSTLTRIGNMTLHATLPVQNQMNRCLLNDDGTVNYYLNSENSALKADGTAADLSGADGQFMVEIPEHWRKRVETETTEEYWLSAVELDGYERVPKTYVSVDEACLDRTNNKLAAVVNGTAQFRGGSNDDSRDGDQYLTLLGRAVSNISWLDFYNYAHARGNGWTNYLGYNNTILYWLFMVEYATTDSQADFNPALTQQGYKQGGLGPDVTEFYDWEDIRHEPFIPTGVTSSLGNHTGVVPYTFQYPKEVETGETDPETGDAITETQTVTHTAQVSSYRGVAVPFGHLAKAASGMLLQAADENSVYLYTCNDPDKISFQPTADYTRTLVPSTLEGVLVKNVGYSNGNLYPVEGFGSPVADPAVALTDYFCDGAFLYGSDAAPEMYNPEEEPQYVWVPNLGGYANSGSVCGFAFAGFVSGPAVASPRLGSRLCFIGE